MRRREFLVRSTLAGSGALFGLGATSAAAEPPPETTRLRLLHSEAICFAPN